MESLTVTNEIDTNEYENNKIIYQITLLYCCHSCDLCYGWNENDNQKNQTETGETGHFVNRQEIE